MDHKTALKLKEHGFTQEGNGMRWSGNVWTSNPMFDDSSYLYQPTLEELIEACSGSLLILADVEDHWNASGYVGQGYQICRGSTPSEAVANLYCALNPIKSITWSHTVSGKSYYDEKLPPEDEEAFTY